MNRKNKDSNSGKPHNLRKNEKAANIFDVKKKGKRIQCQECEGFGHIQYECANTLNEKGKSLNSP